MTCFSWRMLNLCSIQGRRQGEEQEDGELQEGPRLSFLLRLVGWGGGRGEAQSLSFVWV